VKPSERAIALVQYLRKEGVSFWADNAGNINVHPAGLLTPDHRELIRAHKPAVVAYLRWYASEMLPDNATIGQWQSEAESNGSKTA
jgi:ABC-type glycerol-3-phosphate transport system substrate-binding protein